MHPRRGAADGAVGAGKDTYGDTLLPWPEEWPAPRPKLWMILTVGYLGALTLLACGHGFWALLSVSPGPRFSYSAAESISAL